MPTNRELFMRAAGTAINTGSLTGGAIIEFVTVDFFPTVRAPPTG